jgi:hypothetical protein
MLDTWNYILGKFSGQNGVREHIISEGWSY